MRGPARPTLFLAAALLGGSAAILPAMPAQAQYADEITATIAPPPLVSYDQPAIPAPGYLWTPGYWGWGAYGYYWVPGTWVLPPQVGFLWTPPWWGFVGGRYLFHAGYWGPTVGFYGGINYGFGYFGAGFEGGYWRGGRLFYNGAVNHFGGVHITNVYTRNVTNITNVTVNNRASFNGPGGITRAPTPAEQAADHAQRIQATATQREHVQMAAQQTDLRASVNHGNPAVRATSRPTAFAPHPASPGYARPGETGFARPGEPGAAPGHAPGFAPGYPHPAAPGYARPGAPGYPAGPGMARPGGPGMGPHPMGPGRGEAAHPGPDHGPPR